MEDTYTDECLKDLNHMEDLSSEEQAQVFDAKDGEIIFIRGHHLRINNDPENYGTILIKPLLH